MSALNRTIHQSSNGTHTILVDVSQGTDEWLEWRKEGITASDVPVILGISPYKTPWRLWAEKVGRINPEDLSRNPNVQRGHKLEDKARQLAEERYNDYLFPVCGEYYEWPTFKASFDGLCVENIPYEFKAPSEKVWDDLSVNGTSSPTYSLYESQVHAQCIVSGSTEGRLIFYKEDENGQSDDIDFPVTLTPERKEEILVAVKAFYECVKTNTPPPINPEKDCYIPDTGNDRFTWESHADQWRQTQDRMAVLEDELKALKKEKTTLQGKLTSQMGDFLNSEFGGVKVTKFSRQGAIDYKKFLKDKFRDEDLTDVLEPYRKASSDQVRVSKSEDELVNREEHEVITNVKASYF